MTLTLPYGAEVVVIGAGPAGSATAYFLAAAGRDVLLLDRRKFPRDKSCGDGLTLPAVRLLDEMGVLDRLGSHGCRVRGVRVFARGRGHRDFEYPRDATPNRGLVVPRVVLDDALRLRAIESGARFLHAHATGLTGNGAGWTGVAAQVDRRAHEISSRVVVVADGSAGRLSRQAGLVSRDAPRPGFAIRAYYEDIRGLSDLLEIHLPLFAGDGRYLLPSYGWIFPTGPSSANVGVGLFEQSPHVNVRQLFDSFVWRLREEDERFSEASLVGEWMGAPLRFDFAPEHCVVPGALAVGDAAGTISPFTGEGISYALESAKLAAQVIDRGLRSQPRSGSPDLQDYRLLLERNYFGYFETGRRAARRYLLAWKVVDGTFDNDRPLFALARRAALFPEGVGELYASRVLDDIAPLLPQRGIRVRDDLLGIGEILIGTVRRDWPFIARVAAVGRGDPGIPFRPALLMLLGAHFGDPTAVDLRPLGAAVELGFVSALAQLSVDDNPRINAQTGAREPNWPNAFAVVSGDFLLAKAYRLACETGVDAAVQLSAAIARVCEARLDELRHAHDTTQSTEERLDTIARRAGPLFELCCGVGAELAGVEAAGIAALRRYGRAMAVAFELADDALASRGGSTTLGRSISAEIRDGLYPIPLVTALQADGETGGLLIALLERLRAGEPVVSEVLQLVGTEEGVASSLDLARHWAGEAKLALAPLPEQPAKVAMIRLAQYVVERARR